MGWYIGNQQVGEVTVNFNGGFTSNEAYVGLKDEYALNKLNLRISIGVYKSKQAMLDGEPAISCSDLKIDVVGVEATQEQLNTMTLGQLVVILLPVKLEELVPTWANKLIADF